MKHITTPKILVLLFCLAALEMHSAQMTAIANGGDWSDAATWSGLREPDDNDTLTIDAGMQVVVDINSPEYVNLRVNVNGELYFEGGQKINMCPGSVFVSGTGVLNGGNPGSKIDECGNTVWNGPGPTYGGGTYGNTTLPVELVSFAAAQSGKDVQISWSTASESNCSHFNVFRSTNGISFEDLARIPGNGTTTQPKNYSFRDASPVNGTNYYRLTQTDFNGAQETFNLIAVNFASTAPECVLTVYPNPCYENCTVTLGDCPGDNGVITVEMLDASGQIVSSSVPERNTQGGFTTAVDTENNLAPGVYIVRSRSSKAVYQQKAVIK